MAIYKNKWFEKWADDQKLSDSALCNAVKEMEGGLIDAELGGNLVKKRVAMDGQGKSGSYRTIVATNKNGKWFFVYGFRKSERSNITKKDEAALKLLAKQYISFSDDELRNAQSKNVLIEVQCNEKNEVINSRSGT